jgi:hypothetical protein
MIAKKTIGVIGPGKHFENKIYPVNKTLTQILHIPFFFSSDSLFKPPRP